MFYRLLPLLGANVFFICEHQLPSFWDSKYTWNYINLYIYKIHNSYFTFENKSLHKLMLSFEWLSTCYFLALYYTGRKRRYHPFPQVKSYFDVPTV